MELLLRIDMYLTGLKCLNFPSKLKKPTRNMFTTNKRVSLDTFPFLGISSSYLPRLYCAHLRRN